MGVYVADMHDRTHILNRLKRVEGQVRGVAAMIDMGLCTWENVNSFMTFENLIAPAGKLPINTSGGDLAEGFIHGMGNVLEATRQIRGQSCNQVPNAKLSLLTGGPASELQSAALLGGKDTL